MRALPARTSRETALQVAMLPSPHSCLWLSQSPNRSYYNSISHHLCPGGCNVLKAVLMAVFSYPKDESEGFFFFLLPKMFLLLFCCKLVLAQSMHSISLLLAESLVLDHYGRQKYCLWETTGLLHFISWMVSESLVICLYFKKKMGKYICPTSGFLIRGKRRWARRERALCLSSKQNKLP